MLSFAELDLCIFGGAGGSGGLEAEGGVMEFMLLLGGGVSHRWGRGV